MHGDFSGRLFCVARMAFIGVLAAVVGLLAPSLSSELLAQKGDDDISAKPQLKDVEAFMEQKLKAAQLTLEGVMTGKFEQIRHNAATMVDLSRHAAWKQMASPSYIQDTADFVSAAEYLGRVAGEGDGEGVILAFNRVTACCANCHQHVRTPRVAAAGQMPGTVFPGDTMLAYR